MSMSMSPVSPSLSMSFSMSFSMPLRFPMSMSFSMSISLSPPMPPSFSMSPRCTPPTGPISEHMLRPIANPPSRFDAPTVDWDEAPDLAHLQIFEDDSQQILSRNDSPDLHFRWSVNPYRGCTHACTYCYARPSHEYLSFGAGTDFETKIVVKTRAPALLRSAFEGHAWVGESILFSGNVDCYQPLEHRYRLTRGCLEVCRDYRNPVAMITKGALITRDLDVLVALNAVTRLRVSFSIPFWDPAIGRAMEPGAPTPARRLHAMKVLADAGITVGINIAPVIPGLNDRDIPALLRAAAAAGATRAGMILVRLPSSVAPYFAQTLGERLPSRADGVLARIRRARSGLLNQASFGARMRGEGPEWDATEQLFRLWVRKLGLNRVAPDAPDGLDPEELPPSTFRRPGAGVQMGLFGGPAGSW